MPIYIIPNISITMSWLNTVVENKKIALALALTAAAGVAIAAYILNHLDCTKDTTRKKMKRISEDKVIPLKEIWPLLKSKLILPTQA